MVQARFRIRTCHAMILLLSILMIQPLIGCDRTSYAPATSSTAGATGIAPLPILTYSGSSLVGATGSSTAITKDFFGLTIRYLVTPYNAKGSLLTPFPSNPLGIMRLWDVFNWAMLQPSKTAYAWTNMDQVVSIAQANGVSNFIFTFGVSPVWASTDPSATCSEGQGTCAPPDMGAFDAFATTLVQRYCGVIRNYETWNEPNSPLWWNGTNDQLLTIAQHLNTIAKDPNNCGCTDGSCSPGGGVNPNQVLLPSIVSPGNATVLNWLDDYLATAGNTYPYADIASFHGYQYNNDPEGIVGGINSFKQILAKHGLANLPLWITEADWGESSSSAQSFEASWLMRYHLAAASAGITRFVWYAYDSCAYGTLYGPICEGVTDKTTGIRPSGQAYAEIQKWLIGSTLQQCSQYQNGLWICQLEQQNGTNRWVVWTSNNTDVTIPISHQLGLTKSIDWEDNQFALGSAVVANTMPMLLE